MTSATSGLHCTQLRALEPAKQASATAQAPLLVLQLQPLAAARPKPPWLVHAPCASGNIQFPLLVFWLKPLEAACPLSHLAGCNPPLCRFHCLCYDLSHLRLHALKPNQASSLKQLVDQQHSRQAETEAQLHVSTCLALTCHLNIIISGMYIISALQLVAAGGLAAQLAGRDRGVVECEHKL